MSDFSIITPTSEQFHPEDSMADPSVSTATLSPTITTGDDLSTTRLSNDTEQFAAQLRDVVTVTENLREQLATQTEVNEQLKAELAGLREEHSRMATAHEAKLAVCYDKFAACDDNSDSQTKVIEQFKAELAVVREENTNNGADSARNLEGFTELLKVQSATAAAQQGHVENLDKLLNLRIAALEKRVNEMMALPNVAYQSMENDKDEAVDIHTARTNEQIANLTAQVHGLTIDFKALHRLRVSLLSVMRSLSWLDAHPDGTILAGFNKGVDEDVNKIIDELRAAGASEAQCQSAREAAKEIFKLDQEDMRHPSRAIQKVCRQGGEQPVAAASREVVTANAKRIDELTAMVDKMGKKVDAAAGKANSTIIGLECALAFATNSLRDEQIAAAENVEAAIADLKTKLATTIETMRVEHKTATEKADAIIAGLRSELAAQKVQSKEILGTQDVPEAKCQAEDAATTPTASAYDATSSFEQAVTTADNGKAICNACDDTAGHYSITPCNHYTCYICSLRRRSLDGDNTCATCGEEAPAVIITNASHKSYAEYHWSEIFYSHDDLGIKYTHLDCYKHALACLNMMCPSCKVVCETWDKLLHHVQSVHGKYVCTICISHKKVFAYEYQLMTLDELVQYEESGEHVRCGLCRKPMLDHAALDAHQVICKW